MPEPPWEKGPLVGGPSTAGVSVNTVGCEAASDGRCEPEAHAVPGKARTVLLMLDTPGHADRIRGILASANETIFDVQWARSLSAGLECLSGGGIDVVLLALSLPDSRGMAALRTVLDRVPDVPIIVLTRSDDRIVATSAVQQGAQDFLVMDELDAKLLERSISYAIERKRAERAFLASQERHRLLIENLPIGLFRKQPGPKGRFLLVNEALVRMFGYDSHAQLLPVGVADLCEDPGDWEDLHRRLLAGGEIIAEEMRLKRRDATPLWGAMTANLVPNSRGKVAYVNGLIEDITERKLLETQLVQAQKLEAMGQLAAGIAHEINTPTQYIGDNTRFVQKGFEDLITLLGKYDRMLAEAEAGEPLRAGFRAAAEEADVEYLSKEIPSAIRQSLEGVSRVTEIVRAMKEFSHPDTEEKALADLGEIIESTITLARNEWKYVAEMEMAFDPVLPLVPVLPGDIKQVILNIVVNAAHAIAGAKGGERKGRITVTTGRDGDWAEIRIGDTGGGIPEKIRGRVFDLFFTTKEIGQGTGQGLAISRAVVVEKHGGTITFDTEVGKGTTFVIRLPIHPLAGSKEKCCA